MAKKAKYLSYIEDTRKHHSVIDQVAKESSAKAISSSLDESIPVTYLDGEDIIQVDATGAKTTLGRVENNRRKVLVGTKTKLSKK